MRSLMQPQFAKQNILPTNINLVSASGHPLPTEGISNATLKFNNKELEHDFFVVDEQSLPTPLILGMDFLKKYKCTISTQPIDFRIEGESVNIATAGVPQIIANSIVSSINTWRIESETYRPDNQEPSQYKVNNAIANEEIILYPGMSSVAKLRIKGKVPQTHQSVFAEFIPNDGSHAQNFSQGLFTITAENDKLFINVPTYNTTDEPIIIDKRTKLGKTNILIVDSYLKNDNKISNQINSVNEINYSCPIRIKKLEDIIDQKITDNAWANAEMKALIREYPRVFSLDDEPLTISPFFKHTIRLTDTIPVFKRPYQIPVSQQTKVQEQLKKMLADGVIGYSRSPYNAPLLPVLKSDGSIRIVTDFRALNNKVVSDHFPLPKMDSIFHKLGKAKVHSTLDLKQGYFQIKLDEESQPYTAFSSDENHYQYLNMPMGIKDASAAFQRIISQLLKDIEEAQAYMDDIICSSLSDQQHLESLKRIVEQLHRAKLSLRISKCHFFKHTIKFLGHIVTQGLIKPDPQKIEAINKIPLPKTKKGLQSFLGISNFYRKFIAGYSGIAEPLTSMCKGANVKKEKKSPTLIWEEQGIKAFEKLKEVLSQDVVLHIPDFNKPFELHCDSSDLCVAGALMQRSDQNGLKPILYYSKMLSKSQQKVYKTIEKEAYAILVGLKTTRPIVLGFPLIISSDHAPLRYLLTKEHPAGRLSRWALELADYNITIKHIKGEHNSVADALSRIVAHEEEQFFAFNIMSEEDKVALKDLRDEALYMEKTCNSDSATDRQHNNIEAINKQNKLEGAKGINYILDGLNNHFSDVNFDKLLENCQQQIKDILSHLNRHYNQPILNKHFDNHAEFILPNIINLIEQLPKNLKRSILKYRDLQKVAESHEIIKELPIIVAELILHGIKKREGSSCRNSPINETACQHELTGSIESRHEPVNKGICQHELTGSIEPRHDPDKKGIFQLSLTDLDINRDRNIIGEKFRFSPTNSVNKEVFEENTIRERERERERERVRPAKSNLDKASHITKLEQKNESKKTKAFRENEKKIGTLNNISINYFANSSLSNPSLHPSICSITTKANNIRLLTTMISDNVYSKVKIHNKNQNAWSLQEMHNAQKEDELCILLKKYK